MEARSRPRFAAYAGTQCSDNLEAQHQHGLSYQVHHRGVHWQCVYIRIEAFRPQEIGQSSCNQERRGDLRSDTSLASRSLKDFCTDTQLTAQKKKNAAHAMNSSGKFSHPTACKTTRKTICTGSVTSNSVIMTSFTLGSCELLGCEMDKAAA